MIDDAGFQASPVPCPLSPVALCAWELRTYDNILASSKLEKLAEHPEENIS